MEDPLVTLVSETAKQLRIAQGALVAQCPRCPVHPGGLFGPGVLVPQEAAVACRLVGVRPGPGGQDPVAA